MPPATDSVLAFALLALLEVVLGIDNLVVLSLLTGRLPAEQQRRARLLGLSLALLTRLALLFSIVALTRLQAPLFSAFGRVFSWRDLVLGAGGLTLVGQSVSEIHSSLELQTPVPRPAVRTALVLVVLQIALTDVVFSIDSVFTAVGLARADQLAIMVAAIVCSILVMMWASGPTARLIQRHPSIKMLALAFLVLIGSTLISQAMGFEVPKGYLYFAMGFAIVVELLNLRRRAAQHSRSEPER